MPRYVQREGGDIVATFANPQPFATEAVADDDAELAAWFASREQPAPLDAEELFEILKGKDVVADTDRPRPKGDRG